MRRRGWWGEVDHARTERVALRYPPPAMTTPPKSPVTWRPTLLRTGAFRLDAGCMFGLIPKVVWSRWFPQAPASEGGIDELNRMGLQTNSLLLEGSDGRLVVVEVGIGDKTAPKEQAIYATEMAGSGRPRAIHDALVEVGASPRDISAVIVTHLHFDHAGALTRLDPASGSPDPERPVLAFPDAEVIVQRQEWEDALANRSTMHRTYLRNHLTAEVARHVRLVEGEWEVLPGITVMPTPGHTWGQQCVRIAAPGGRTLVFVCDVMPTRRHARPTCNLAYDVEPYTSMLQRIKLLDRATDEDWTLVLDHEADHCVFRVRRAADGSHSLEPASL